MYVIVNSQKDKGKALRKHILKNIALRGFDARIEEIQERHQRVIEQKDATMTLLNGGLQNREYENACLQHEIRAKDH